MPTRKAPESIPAAQLERQLAAAQQIAHMGSWQWELATNAVTWSDELYRIYGLEPQSVEITFETFLARVHPDDREHTTREVRAALERGGRFAYPERIVRPDGSVRALETIGEVLHDESGKPIGLLGTCRDVTEERKRDEQIRLYGKIVENVQIGLAVWEVGDPNDVGSVRLTAFNPAAERIARQPLGPYLGKPIRDVIPYAAGGQLETIVLAVARDGEVRDTSVLRSSHPHDPARAVAIKAFPVAPKCIGVAVEDISQQTRDRRIQYGEAVALEMIATGMPLSDILSHVAKVIEDDAPGTLASILLLDEDGTHVRHGAAPSLPEAFVRAIDGAPIGPKAGSCGTAAFRKEPVYVEDIDTDPLWDDYRELARAHGLRACWSRPFFAKDGRVLGTFAIYARQPRAPADADRTLIARAARIAAIAVENRQMEEQLHALSEHVEEVREDERTGIAREIHDQLGQSLTALKMDIAWLGRRANGQETVPSAVVNEKLKEMSQLTDEIINQVRRISAELRPGVLDDLGLSAAIEWQAMDFERRTETPCVIRTPSEADRLPLDPRVSTAVFRAFQEALTNVARHAKATRVEVKLDIEGDDLVLEVSDDGRGIAPEAITSPKSLGLLGIRERARRLGGTARVEANAGGGTTLSFRVPIGEDRVRSSRGRVVS